MVEYSKKTASFRAPASVPAVNALYFYDADEYEKISKYESAYTEWQDNDRQGEAPRLKDYSDMWADEKPCNSMLKLLRKFDGLRIYCLDSD